MYNYPKLNEARQRAKELGLPMPHSSQRKGKKLFIVYNGRKIHFGSRSNSDYLIHNDDEQRERFHTRATKIRSKDGSFAYQNMNSPLYYSVNILW
jgi:hypothetical protein